MFTAKVAHQAIIAAILAAWPSGYASGDRMGVTSDLVEVLSGDDWTIVSFEPGAGVKAKAHDAGYPMSKAIPAMVPGDVHWDLERSGKVDDIYYGMNSRNAWWVATKEWWYRKTFRVREDWKGKTVRLHFDAVDYKADVWLNGRHLGQHEGQFTPFEFVVTDDLTFERDNVLTVLVHAAPKHVTDTVSKDVSEHHVMGAMGTAYPYLKSMTSSGWDWGCDLISMGIWQDVCLIASKDVYLSNLTVLPDVPAPYDKATLRIKTDVEAKEPRNVRLSYEVQCTTAKNSPLVAQKEVAVASGKHSIAAELELLNPRLWWPNGYGEQHLYELTASALDSKTGALLSRTVTTFGVRELKMLANPHSPDHKRYLDGPVIEMPDPKPELKYLMRINGRKILGMGSNWLPCDMLFGRPGKEFHQHLIRLAAEANMNLFRIWGGGLIDKQILFDLCDKHGIMLFAEFPSIGPHRPETKEGLAITASETRQVLPLLMNHPCVVRYGGGNEWSLGVEASKQMAQLQRICNETDPTRPFHYPDPETIAQRHGPHWYHVAPHHKDNQYKIYNTGYPLTYGPEDPVEWNEYGAAGASSVETLRRIMPQENTWPIKLDDPYWKWHKALWAFCGENWLAPTEYEYLFGKPADLETMVRCSQFCQAEGLRYANQTHRRHQWHRSAFVSWTYNEPWPNAAHGCIVEYYGKTKMAYYYARQSYAPVEISAVYSGLICGPDEPLRVETWISSILAKPLSDHLVRWRVYSTSGQVWAEGTETVCAPANDSAKVASINFRPTPEMLGDVALLYIELLDPTQTVIAQNLYTFGIQRRNETSPQGLSICKAIATNPGIAYSPWRTSTAPAGTYDVVELPRIPAGANLWAREWKPGVDGAFHVYGSWGACPRHAEKAQFVIDLDGDVHTTGDQSTMPIDARLMADQTTPAEEPGSWSGFRCLGTFELNSRSAVRLLLVPGTKGRYMGLSSLAIRDAKQGRVSRQPVQAEPPLKPLLHAPATKLTLNGTPWREIGTGGICCDVEVTNTSSRPALFVKLSVEAPQHVRVYYEDNYFFLPPGQTRRIELRLTSKRGLPINRPLNVQAQSWNSRPPVLTRPGGRKKRGLPPS